jgi:hypothetical protein
MSRPFVLASIHWMRAPVPEGIIKRDYQTSFTDLASIRPRSFSPSVLTIRVINHKSRIFVKIVRYVTILLQNRVADDYVPSESDRLLLVEW